MLAIDLHNITHTAKEEEEEEEEGVCNVIDKSPLKRWSSRKMRQAGERERERALPQHEFERGGTNCSQPAIHMVRLAINLGKALPDLEHGFQIPR